VDLPVGGSRIIDAFREASCIRLVSGPEDREYVLMALSGNGQEAPIGISGGFSLRAEPTPAEIANPMVSALPVNLRSAGQSGDFHQMLRLRERDLARSPLAALGSAPRLMPVSIPVVGEKDTFNVCSTHSCNNFVRVGTTARYVGSRGVIYLDDDISAGSQALTQGDLDQLGTLFDEYIYPLDTVAFGAESDINSDQRIGIVITDQVNALTTDCTNGRTVGYFFGGDLLTSYPGSNQREVFFTFSPKPATSGCPEVTRARAMAALGPVLIHELQHMISFNQRVLRRGLADETVWLNEGLSHFAEELGQRFIPDARCPHSPSCFSEYATGNLYNAYQYLENPEASFLVAPTNGTVGLAQRGAGWLFVRWLADHYATDTLRGTTVTRALLQGSNVGAANVQAAAQTPFATLVAEWGLANWLDNLPGFPQAGRLRYRTWDFRDVFGRNSPGVFDREYPLIPDSTGATHLHNGTLRGGSGYHVRIAIKAGTSGGTIRLSGPGGSGRLDSYLEPRIAVARIR
jgi:hypothetical protein